MKLFQRGSRRANLSAALLLALGVALGLTGCSASAPASPLAAATVNGHAISLDDYEQVLAFAQVANNSGGPYNWQSLNGRGNASNEQTQVMTFLVNIELMREALADQHVSVSAKEMQVAQKQFDDNLKSGLTSADSTTKVQAKAELPYATSRVRYLIAEQTAYEAKLISVLNLWTVHLHDIIVPTKAQADDLLTKLTAGGDFATLATQTNPNATDGGDYGTAWYGQLPNEFTIPLFGKNPDKDTPVQYSVVPYNNEYVVVEVTDKKQQKLTTDTDTTDQSNIFSQWLGNEYFAKRQHQEFVYIPPAPTQQVTQG